MENKKIRLNSATSQESVNENSFLKVQLKSNREMLPIDEVTKVINSGKQFNEERENSKFYRLTGTFNTLFNNVLLNTTGNNSLSTFNSIKFRNNILLTSEDENELNEDEGDITYKESIKKYLKEDNGWFGYNDPDPNNMSLCKFTDLEPNRRLFSMSKKDGVMNWDLTVTYPVSIGNLPGDINHPLVLNGLAIISVENTTIGGRDMLTFTTAVKHGLSKGETVNLSNLPSNEDYEIFPLAFSNTIYEDNVYKYVINEDIDISNLKDNLGRPLSEIYITVIKKNNAGFTNIKSGLKIPFINDIDVLKTIPDINRITDSSDSHEPLNSDVNITQDEFFGDVVEYNVLEQEEKILADVYHRFNTVNRINQNNVLSNTDFTGGSVNFGIRHEGYQYKAHHKIQIRKFSNYIEQGTPSTLNKPSYATNLNDGRFIWRDLLDIGLNDGTETTLDYPFLNGVHYINSNFILALERQDPFNFYKLQHTQFPSDISGILVDDNYIIKNTDDAC